MGSDSKQTLERKKHLFRVEIMVEESTQTMALAALLQALNHPMVNDFRILEGIQFGKEIEKTIQENSAKPFSIPPKQSVPVKKATAGAAPAPTPPPADSDNGLLNLDNLLRLKESGTLVRIVIVKGKGVKLSIPCRILNFDGDGQHLTIYHVDEKKVYTFNLNEIEDIII